MMHGDLFSGIGGFALAARWMGWRTAWFSEIDPFASRVLAHHWPDVTNYGDITRIDWATVEPVDILTAGFPCQPHSLAGKRLGAHDDRDLFDEVIRALTALRPRYLVLENVAGLLTSNGGQFFGRVLGALAERGYDARWEVVPAYAVGSPQERPRLWVTAWREWEPIYELDDFERCECCDDYLCPRCDCHAGYCACLTTGRLAEYGDLEYQSRPWGDVAYASGERGRGWEPAWEHAVHADARGEDGVAAGGRGWWATGPTVCGVGHGLSGRMDRLRGLGNAIVPQCAYEIFQHITAAPRRTETR